MSKNERTVGVANDNSQDIMTRPRSTRVGCETTIDDGERRGEVFFGEDGGE